MYVPWPVSRQSEPLIPETDENRLWAFVTGRPRPPRRLQTKRKVTTTSTSKEISHSWRLEWSLRHMRRAAVWQCCSVRTRMSRKLPMPSKKSTIWFRRKTGSQCRCGCRWEPSRHGAHYNFGYFSPVILMRRSMCLRGGLGFSKRIISLGFYGFAVNFLVCWEVKNTNMTIVWVHTRPFTASVPYSHLHMIWGGSLMESFAGLLQRLVVL